MTDGRLASPPLLVVLSGLSGAGKDTLLDAALAQDPLCEKVVTATTRSPRAGEVDGVHYLFLSDAEFDAQIEAGAFLEHAAVYGHRSGVPRDQVRAALAAGRTGIVHTDVQGARTIRTVVPGAVLIFVTVPDLATLERRLRRRAADSESDLQRRLQAAREEMDAADSFDYVITNREGEAAAAVQEFLAILAQERTRSGRPLPTA